MSSTTKFFMPVYGPPREKKPGRWGVRGLLSSACGLSAKLSSARSIDAREAATRRLCAAERLGRPPRSAAQSLPDESGLHHGVAGGFQITNEITRAIHHEKFTLRQGESPAKVRWTHQRAIHDEKLPLCQAALEARRLFRHSDFPERRDWPAGALAAGVPDRCGPHPKRTSTRVSGRALGTAGAQFAEPDPDRGGRGAGHKLPASRPFRFRQLRAHQTGSAHRPRFPQRTLPARPKAFAGAPRPKKIGNDDLRGEQPGRIRGAARSDHPRPGPQRLDPDRHGLHYHLHGLATRPAVVDRGALPLLFDWLLRSQHSGPNVASQANGRPIALDHSRSHFDDARHHCVRPGRSRVSTFPQAGRRSDSSAKECG